MITTPRDLISVTEAAELLGISRTTLYAAIRNDIASVPGAARIGRRVIIRRAAFEAWLRCEDVPDNVVPFLSTRKQAS